ncbi:beta strand repeat-containing protein, partial [Kordia zhangzhouensis]|uniref:beta strand repeat-containing protein n=1 Tax=Kordia zhangzhouensis TaxID=1620405 RepID=UPI0006291D45
MTKTTCRQSVEHATLNRLHSVISGKLKMCMLLLAFSCSVLFNVSFAQNIAATNGQATPCGNCAPPGWTSGGGTPDVSNSNTVAGPGAGLGEGETWNSAPLPLPPNGHATWITVRDVGTLAAEESIFTTITGLTVGRTYEVVIYSNSALTPTYGPQYIDFYQVQIQGFAQQNITQTGQEVWQTTRFRFTAVATSRTFTFSPGNNMGSNDANLESVNLSVSLNAINTAPVADNNSAVTAFNTPVSFNVVSTDVDFDGSIVNSTVDLDVVAAGIQNTGTTAEGSWSVDANGVVTFTPNAGFYGVATLNYNVQDDYTLDGQSLPARSNNATLTVTVSPPDSDGDGVDDLTDEDDDNDGILDTQELCGTNPVPLNPDSVVRIEIDIDQYSTEVGWSLSLGGNTVASVPTGTYGVGNVTVSQDITVTENGNYLFTITDTFGDGIQGNSYRIFVDGTQVINRTFGSPTDTTTFNQTDNFLVNTIVTNPFSCLSDDPSGDSDGDGILNYQDADFCVLNGNGVCASLDSDGDGLINSLDTDSDNDTCADALEAGHADDDADGILGNSPVTVDAGNGRVTGQGGYTGTNLAVTNSGNTSACDTCELLSASVSAVFCDDNGTPLNDADDTFTFYINPNGTLLGATYSVTGDVTRSNIAYDLPEQFGPFPISGGNIVFTITDDADGSCQLIDVTVTPPAACSSSSSVDTDGDGITDNIDIDNDNDGIIDDNENICGARPLTTGSWTGSNPYSNTAGAVGVTYGSSIPAGGQITYVPNGTMTTTAFFSDAAVQGANSLEFLFTWDTSPESSNAAADDRVVGTVTITYSQPVYNPIIHIDRLGGNTQLSSGGYVSNTSIWTLQTAGLSMAKISGNNQLIVNSKQFYRDPNQNLGTGDPIVLSGDADNAGLGTAAGSIQIYGSVTTLTFQVTGEGLDGNGSDRLEMVFDSCSVIDTDGDSIPDFLDVDSDNDGCPDAIEGAASFTSDDLTSSNNLADADEGAVNPSNGVPTNAGSPQATTASVTTATQVVVDAAALVNQTVFEGSSTTFAITSASAINTTSYSGGTPDYGSGTDASSGINYQWYIGDPDSGGTAIAPADTNYSNENTDTLTIVDVTGLNGTQYCLLITHDDNSCIREINCATLTVEPLVAMTVGDVTVA